MGVGTPVERSTPILTFPLPGGRNRISALVYKMVVNNTASTRFVDIRGDAHSIEFIACTFGPRRA